MTMRCFFAVCWKSNALQPSGHFQLDYHCGSTLFSLPTGVLENVDILGLYDIIQLAGCDPVLCL